MNDRIVQEIDEVFGPLRATFKGWVWSSGLEEWEPIDMSWSDWVKMTFLYHKTMWGVSIPIFRDSLGRFIAIKSL